MLVPHRLDATWMGYPNLNLNPGISAVWKFFYVGAFEIYKLDTGG